MTCLLIKIKIKNKEKKNNGQKNTLYNILK